MTRASVLGKRKREHKHPYLSGNFAPIQQLCPLTPCKYEGTIPDELLGGEYIRNGGNPVSNDDLGRDAHWFDGDGMLSGVSFTRKEGFGAVLPEFVNQYILTDVLLSSLDTHTLRRPIMPSITTLVNPVASLFQICICILRSLFLVLLSRLPGSKHAIKKISVANTAIMYHDGRALATCESGPPLRIALPSLETVGWFNGQKAEGEPDDVHGPILGGNGPLSFMKEWTTAHPKVDPDTNEMILFHSNFAPPYVHYSIIPATHNPGRILTSNSHLLNVPVPGILSAKMMHDFGVSKRTTVIMDLPLSLDPLQLVKNKPVISYNPSKPSRFGVFPRSDPDKVEWFESAACCIFHTVNTWDIMDQEGNVEAVDMMACRLTSASLVFNAGNMFVPDTIGTCPSDSEKPISFFATYDEQLDNYEPLLAKDDNAYATSNPEYGTMSSVSQSAERSCHGSTFIQEEDQCRLYYYSFRLSSTYKKKEIKYQFALSAIPFEFPSVSPKAEMSAAKYVYGCTTTGGNFGSALGRAVKVDALVKFDVQALISRGKSCPPPSITGCVDQRDVAEILVSSKITTSDQDPDPIQIFQLPPGIYAQEPRFVPAFTQVSEDSGFLLSYVFDESQLLPSGDPPPSAVSELWLIDAKGMKDVLAKVFLPQRVPYGLHGNWFPEEQIQSQRPVEYIRKLVDKRGEEERYLAKLSRNIRNGLVAVIGG